jgi:hypothetical protein
MNKLLVAGLESSFQVFDMRTQHPEDGFASVTEKVSLIGLLVIRYQTRPKSQHFSK